MAEQVKAAEVITANSRVPYALVNRALRSDQATDYNSEATQVAGYYNIYHKGVKVITEGSGGDYVPATLRYKLTAQLINKQARFLFGERPEFTLSHMNDANKISEDDKRDIQNMQSYVDNVLDSNQIEDAVIKAARDCFIGKRVAYMVNFNEELGVSITWLNSMQFYYETFPENQDVLSKFVAWVLVNDSKNQSNKRIWQKKYEVGDDGIIRLSEGMFNGSGELIGTETVNEPIELTQIPARVILNDGLTGELKGVSDVLEVKDYEQYYSRLANADIDAERRGMNPIKYTIDMSVNSTKKLSAAPGSYWDLSSDSNMGENVKGAVGTIESSLSYSGALDTTLKRTKGAAFEQLDIPDVTLESMAGVISSGKALKAVYWPMIVRCKEKFKAWEPHLRKLVDILIEGAIKYPNTVKKYTLEAIQPTMYRCDVVNAFPLPEDESEEKANDLAEVMSNTMSKKSYMKKWRKLSDPEVEVEIEQMALERELLEESYPSGHTPEDIDEEEVIEDKSLEEEE